MAIANLTAQRVREVLNYDPETGVITWAAGKGSRARAGSSAGWEDARYHYVSIDGNNCRRNRIAWVWMTGKWPVGQVDHRNGNGKDDRWCNLRDVSHAVNQQNQRIPSSNNTSGYLGVTWDKAKGKWLAQIKVRNRNVGLGRFSNAEQASFAYLDAKRRLHPGCTI